MTIKKLKVSFEIDVELFAKILAHGNSGMNIEVYGDGGRTPSAPRVSHTKVARVGHDKEHPARKQMAILEALSKRQFMDLKEISAVCEKAGFAPSINSCMNTMVNTGTVKRVRAGLYAITKKGAEYVNVEAVQVV